MDFKDYNTLIEKLYTGVSKREKDEFMLGSDDIERSMKDMSEAYGRRNGSWQWDSLSRVVDYNNASNRCAYLHKYAMIHTDLMCTLLQAILRMGSVKDNIDSKKFLNLCSLGGGPGTDIVALLLAIQEVIGLKECSASIIDTSAGWEYTFAHIVTGLMGITDSGVSSMVDESRFRYRYLAADLLNPSSFDDERVHQAISHADIITMVRFISAAACSKVGDMLEKIFQAMKPGCLLLFVDSAGGGFHETVESKAEKCGLEVAYGPIKHFEWDFSASSYHSNLKYPRQFKTKMTIEMWIQPLTASDVALAESENASLLEESGLISDAESSDESCTETAKILSVNKDSSEEYDGESSSSCSENISENDDSCREFDEGVSSNESCSEYAENISLNDELVEESYEIASDDEPYSRYEVAESSDGQSDNEFCSEYSETMFLNEYAFKELESGSDEESSSEYTINLFTNENCSVLEPSEQSYRALTRNILAYDEFSKDQYSGELCNLYTNKLSVNEEYSEESPEEESSEECLEELKERLKELLHRRI